MPSPTLFAGTKGGVGCSTLAAAYAVMLAKRDVGSVLLVDAATGDLPAILGMPEPAGPGLGDLIASNSLDHDRVRRITTLVPGLAQLSLLSRGDGPLRRLDEMFDTFAECYDHVVIDVGVRFDLAPAFVVVRSDYLSLRRLAALQLAHGTVVSMNVAGSGLTHRDVEHLIGGLPMLMGIVDPLVQRSVDAGLFTSRIPPSLNVMLTPVIDAVLSDA